MGRSGTVRSTIGRDPFDAVIPQGESNETAAACGGGEPAAQPAARRGRPRSEGSEVPANRDRQAAGEQVGEGRAPVRVPPTSQAAGEVTPVGAVAAPARSGTGRRKEKLTVHLDEDLVNRVKNAAYWNPRLNIARIAERGSSARSRTWSGSTVAATRSVSRNSSAGDRSGERGAAGVRAFGRTGSCFHPRSEV